MKKASVKRQEEQLKQAKKTARLLKILITLVTLLLGVGIWYLFELSKSPSLDDKIVIMLDAGCDQKHPSSSGYVSEVEYSEKLVDVLEKKLKKDRNFEVVLSHEAGSNMSSLHRVDKMSELACDLVVSVHVNGSYQDSKSGMKIYASDKNEKSLAFANVLQEELGKDAFVGYLYYVPVDENTFEVVESVDVMEYETKPIFGKGKIPVVYVNTYYGSNVEEASYYNSEEGLEHVSDAYVRAIQRTFANN